MKIQRSQKKDIPALETVYEAAFASNVFPDNMTEEEGDNNADLSPAISIQRDDLITLTIYENGIIALSQFSKITDIFDTGVLFIEGDLVRFIGIFSF